MYKFSKLLLIAIIASVLSPDVVAVFAQESPNDGIEAWRELDEELRQAIVEVIAARRGLDPNVQNPDSLIRSAEDIAEALGVSCELSGACGDDRLGENLISFPEYDEQEGRLNAQRILRRKMGYEN